MKLSRARSEKKKNLYNLSLISFLAFLVVNETIMPDFMLIFLIFSDVDPNVCGPGSTKFDGMRSIKPPN